MRLHQIGWPPSLGTGAYRGAEKFPTQGIGTLESVRRETDQDGSTYLTVVITQDNKRYIEPFKPPAELLDAVESLLVANIGGDINMMSRLEIQNIPN